MTSPKETPHNWLQQDLVQVKATVTVQMYLKQYKEMISFFLIL